MNPILVFTSILVIISSVLSIAPPKHWHESNGFGTNTKGGLGGKIIKVTNLNSTGEGSLHDALMVQSGKRLIVFEVGGVIDIGKLGVKEYIKNGNVTIAGQTAPYPGITLIKGHFVVEASDVVVSHIAIRLGDQTGARDVVDIIGSGTSNVVFDHVSVSWGTDEGFSITSSKNITIYKCYIAEQLSHTPAHPEPEHSKGSLIQKSASNISIIKSVYAFNCLRMPRLHSSAKCAMLNSLIYGWEPGKDDAPEDYNYLISLAGASMSVVGNVAIQGPKSVGEYLVSAHKGKSGDVYMKNNIIIDPQGKPLKEHDGKIKVLSSPPLWPDNFKEDRPEESLYEIMRTVGSRPGIRDQIDNRIVGHIAKGTGKVIDSQEEVGGFPAYPETRRTLPQIPVDAQAQQDWLDALEDQLAVDIQIDLSRLYSLVGSATDDKFIVYKSTNISSPGKTSKSFTIIKVQSNFSLKQLQASVSLPSQAEARLQLFTLSGNTVGYSVQKKLDKGNHTLTLDVKNLPAGLYMCRFKAGNTIENQLYHHY